MVFVEGGTFSMGCTDDNPECQKREKPNHTVTLSSFYLSPREVTQAEYKTVTGETPGMRKKCTDCPVNRVSWYDALEFCNKKSELDGLETYYTIDKTEVTINANANGYRLPTEAEWEYAISAQKRLALGPDYKTSEGWFMETGNRRLESVGQKEPNLLGIFDMWGNVWEWCWDAYGPYSEEAQTNPLGAAKSKNRVMRGGSYLSLARLERISSRNFETAGTRKTDIGFRIARNVEE